ncbi:MAG: hypothetical protein HY699_11860 [Deltaproteobacteria bacterium]|nr:hypothetical protein [Deltaproteobacteria bacterium]
MILDDVSLAGNQAPAANDPSHSGQRPGGFFALRMQRLAAFEREFIAGLLERHCGDVAAAAREAQLPRGTLYRLLKKHSLNPKAFRGTQPSVTSV